MVAELKIGVVKSEVLTGLCLCALIMLFATVEPSTHVVLLLSLSGKRSLYPLARRTRERDFWCL